MQRGNTEFQEQEWTLGDRIIVAVVATIVIIGVIAFFAAMHIDPLSFHPSSHRG
jgi:hypothetical protein